MGLPDRPASLKSLVWIGAAGCLVSLSQGVPTLMERRDIWWTPKAMALPVETAQEQVEILLQGQPIARSLQEGKLAIADGPEPRQLSPDDVRVRLNNYHKTMTSKIPILVVLSVAFGMSLAVLVFGLVGPRLLKAGADPGPASGA